MEQKQETLGRRIAALRKARGWTQEQLAEKIGISPQAVSKWENDLSCPDISTLPLLADLFGVSTDELLGVRPADPHVVVLDQDKEHGKGDFHWEWKAGGHSAVAVSVTAILVGITLLWRELDPARFPAETGAWQLVWPILVFGFGLAVLLGRRSAVRIGFGSVLMLYGGYQFLYTLCGMPENWLKISWYAALLVLAIISLSVSLYRKITGKKKPRAGKTPTLECDTQNGRFRVDASFGSETITAPAGPLTGADIDTSFGDYTIDMTHTAFEANAVIKADVCFGNVTLLLPAGITVIENKDLSFGACSVHGTAPGTGTTVYLTGDVSFGNLDIRYPD